MQAAAGRSTSRTSEWRLQFTIVEAGLSLLAQLGFLGNALLPLWTLTVIGLDALVLYALMGRWNDASEVTAPPRAIE